MTRMGSNGPTTLLFQGDVRVWHTVAKPELEVGRGGSRHSEARVPDARMGRNLVAAGRGGCVQTAKVRWAGRVEKFSPHLQL